MEALLAEKAARSPQQRKISSQLLYARDGMPGAKDQKVTLEPINPPDAQGRWLVDMKALVDPALLAKVEALGGSVILNSPGHTSLRARVPLNALDALAADDRVVKIRQAFDAKTNVASSPRGGMKFALRSRQERIQAVQQAVQHSLLSTRPSNDLILPHGTTNVGAATSEGSRAHGADRARQFFGVDGTGVKVGVLSDSDDFKEQSIATGDLPPDTVTVPGQDGRPGAGEGTAMMQIVHDVAPGAKLFFATAFTSPESFADNIRTLRFTYGCDIIVDDVIYFFENPFQDDIIAQAVSDVIADGAMYFSSAGNEGALDPGTSGTWEGDFRSAGTFEVLPSGYEVHDFSGGVIGNRIELGGGPLILHWSDPGTLDNPQSSNDYDLFVISPDMRSVAVAATDIQDGNDLPFEFLGFNIPADYRVVIAKKPGAADRVVRTVLFGGELALATSGATYGHATAEGAMGVAAVDVALAGTGEFTGGQTTQTELFSSDGYRQVFYDRFGNPINGGDGETRITPNLTAADGVSTTLPSGSGLNPFFGTSAAAPHAGAVAALLLSAMPDKPNWYITTVLAASATDIMAPGGDSDSGAGIVNAFDALTFAGAEPAVNLVLGTVTASGSLIPGGSGSLSVQLVNSGGATARNVNATLTTATSGVVISSGSSAYPDIAAGGGSATNASPFNFSLSSGVPCGLRVDFTITVSFDGFGHSPASFSFSVQTGNPSATETVISYGGAPAPIPDDNAAGVNVPLAVSGIGVVSSVSFSIDGTVCTSAIGATTVGLDHTWVGDLVATLTSPSGTSVTLFSRPGGTGNSGNNFCQTVLTDSATNNIQSIAVAGAPWTGSFKPASPLSAFNGQNANGTWVLNVADLALIDTGSVRAFSLHTRGFSCGP
jgi:subtilisin-like proprotein convertase family protein